MYVCMCLFACVYVYVYVSALSFLSAYLIPMSVTFLARIIFLFESNNLYSCIYRLLYTVRVYGAIAAPPAEMNTGKPGLGTRLWRRIRGGVSEGAN